MARIISEAAYGTTIINLDLLPCFRLAVKPTTWWDQRSVAIGLVVISESATVLVRMPCRLVNEMPEEEQRVQALHRVCDHMLCTGEREKDEAATKEAFLMFANQGKGTLKEIDSHQNDGLELVSAYWELRQWLHGGARGNIDIVCHNTSTRLALFGD
jgi:hypothetical protein